jgi:DNA-binding PadR family transcriptional regulator
MGHPGFNRQWAGPGERGRGNRKRRGPWAEFDFTSGWNRPGHQGPPPWVTGLFGLGQMHDQRRGPRVRRGDVRSAILDVLRAAGESAEPVNGYQVIQQISDRSEGAWRPSPGSVYPTIQQLEDEGLVESDDERGRRALRLSETGRQYVAEHADQLAAVWRPFEREAREEQTSFSGLKPEIGQVMGAVWQIVTAGSEAQQQAAIDVLVETRRKLYGILADGDEPSDEEDES